MYVLPYLLSPYFFMNFNIMTYNDNENGMPMSSETSNVIVHSHIKIALFISMIPYLSSPFSSSVATIEALDNG